MSKNNYCDISIMGDNLELIVWNIISISISEYRRKKWANK